MVSKTAVPAKKDVGKKPAGGKQSKKEDDEPYVASKQAKSKKTGGDEKSDVKRPLSAFFHFCAERRVTLKTE